MEGSEKFCLRWNDFESNISDAFKELREEKDFFDVTLACDDSQIEAHKVILSACSPFFRNILRRNPHQHPLLYIKGVKYKELLSVLNFMYMGEVNVAQDELNSFLAVAEELRVKGLTQNNPSSGSAAKNVQRQEPPRQINRPREPPEKDPFPPPKRPKPAAPAPASVPQMKAISNNFTQDDDDDEIQEVIPVKSEPNEEPAHTAIHKPVAISQPAPLVDYPPQEQDQPLPGTMAVDESFSVDESYNYDQYYEDGSGMMEQSNAATMGGADANKVKVKSPSKLYLGIQMEPIVTIHHHPGEPLVKEEDLGLNPFSMDSTDCFADPTQDWDTVVANRMLKKENIWQCLECSYMARNKTSVISHVQGKHLEDFGGYVCKLCGGKSGTYCGFEKHMSRQHKFSLARKNIL
eukprot:GFUD01012954.1.p1 GENE.GFUD01012954.1~~GFUD01012954.1.p1  ORF type:complete len:406 (-),score=106.77 GFUD01012954.1:124-1341(-)